MKHIVLILITSILFLHVSAQKQIILESEFLNKPDTIWVFTPDSDSNEPYPVLYLLHGWSGDFRMWHNMIDCQYYANKYQFIIVCPDGLYDSWYIDSPVESENQYESFFNTELIPTISQKFNIQKDNIFITGLSMGGHGSLYLFEKNPDYFKSAGSLSGLLDLTTWWYHYGINRVLGLTEQNNKKDLLEKYSVTGNIANMKLANKKIIVSCGTEDPFYEINRSFIDSCSTHNIDVSFLQSSGGHNTTYWSTAVNGHFNFFNSLISD